MEEFHNVKDNIIDAIEADKENTSPVQQANNVSSDVLQQFTKALTILTDKVDQLEKQNTNRRNNRSTDPDVPFWKRPGNKYKYCWSCGSQSDHDSSTCSQKKDEHVDKMSSEVSISVRKNVISFTQSRSPK